MGKKRVLLIGAGRRILQNVLPVFEAMDDLYEVAAIYMDAVVAMTGQGGWPMPVFLAPDGRPVYGGTYYPDRSRGGMPAFTDVLRAVHEAWTER